MNEKASPMLPLAAQLPGTLILSALLVIALRMVEGRNAKFVVFACWVRFILSAYHSWTFPRMVGPLSINAIGSIAVFALGLLLIDRKLLLSRALIPLYLLLGAIILSAIVNARLDSGFDTIVKFGYFAVLALHGFEALRREDRVRLTRALLLAFSPLVLFQILSVVLGVAKAGESDGSVSYIGGYHHEAHFSLGLFGLFVVGCLGAGLNRPTRLLIVMVALVGIYLANYRTVIIGALPLLALFAANGLGAFFARHLRGIAISVMGAVLAVACVTAVLSMDRFSDLRSIVSGEHQIIKEPRTFNRADARILSGRSLIWSEYYYGWKNGSPVQHLVGYGPDSWTEVFDVYAHNSFFDFLYEYGLIGVAALTLFVGSGFWLSIRAARDERMKLLASHASFLLLNLATMPMWQIEGLIALGLIWAYTIYGNSLRRAETHSADTPRSTRPPASRDLAVVRRSPPDRAMILRSPEPFTRGPSDV